MTLAVLALNAFVMARGPVLCEAVIDSDGQLTLKALNLTSRPMALLNHPSCIRLAQKVTSKGCDSGLMASNKDAVLLPPGRVITVQPESRFFPKAGVAIHYGGIPAEAYGKFMQSLMDGKDEILPLNVEMNGMRIDLMPFQTIPVRWIGTKAP
jgi:hypothetical protein